MKFISGMLVAFVISILSLMLGSVIGYEAANDE